MAKETNIQENPFVNSGNTENLRKLVEVEMEKRDEEWVKSLLENIVKTGFKVLEPQVITGPDGFPYFNLVLADKGEEYQPIAIENILGYIITNGIGLVINFRENANPDFVFTYGDVLNYGIRREFFSENEMFTRPGQAPNIEPQEQVMVANPANDVLPKEAREVMKNFFQQNNLADAKIALMKRTKDGKEIHDLVFNVTPVQFPNEDAFKAVMQTVSWFLPKNYSYITVDENSLTGAFHTL